MKRFFVGLGLAFVFYIGACFTMGAVAGAIAGAKDPAHAAEAGARAGQEMGEKYGTYALVAAIAFGVLGAWVGVGPRKITEFVDADVPFGQGGVSTWQ